VKPRVSEKGLANKMKDRMIMKILIKVVRSNVCGRLYNQKGSVAGD